MPEERITIADLLAHISDELRNLHEAAARTGHTPFMRFQECELELAVEAEKTEGVGLKVYLLNLAGGRKKTNSHTIKVKMSALTGPPQEHDLVAFSEPAEQAGSSKKAKQKKKRQGKKIR